MFKSITISLLLLSVTAHAGEKEKWDVNHPGGPHKEVRFTVDEGTWMNLDVSPDGKTIVFDLLGDIYQIPAEGGKARPLRTGLAFEVQPRFSPDGKQILFTSDAGGGDNIWVMNADGSNARQVTKETFRLLNNAAWTPDGQYLVARKHFTSERSLGAGEIWMYHISGGKGLQLTTKKNDQQDVNEPVVSADGRYVYFSEDMYPGGHFQYNKDPNKQIFVIRRFDRQTGKTEQVTGGSGGAMRPQLSNDGRKLAFIRRVRTRTVLFLRDLQTGEEWPVYDQLTKDQQEAWTIFGAYTGFDWMPDDRHILIWSEGKILKIDVETPNTATTIPFEVDVVQQIAEVVRYQQDINPDKFQARVLQSTATAPDGKEIVFSALGYLHRKSLPGGTPNRITATKDYEFDPAYAPDGKQLVYVSWNDSATGAIHLVDLGRPGRSKRLTTGKGIYRNPSFSADGKWIVFEMENGNNVLGPGYTSRPGVYVMPAEGGVPRFVTHAGGRPRFSADGKRVYVQKGGGLNKQFLSVDLNGLDEQPLIKSTYGGQFRVSPDGNWIAFVDLHNVYIAAFPQVGKTIELGSGTEDFPVKKVSRDAGLNLHWSGDGKRLHYTLGDQYFTIPLEERFSFLSGQPDSLYKIPDQGIAIGLEAETYKPGGSIAFKGARIITMRGDEVIENGVILVEGNKIKSVGAAESIAIPAGARVIDVQGKTILPGFIDAHAHAGHFREGILPEKHWPYYANLAYGVTTLHDPSANSELVFAQSELVRAGQMVGPRIFSTGTILYGAEGDFKAVINSLEDARSALRRTRAFGAFSVKSYNQPRRDQRQQVIAAARELGMEVVPEGGSFFFHNLSMILDGHTTIEHNMPISELYDDVIQLWKQSGTAYTPTLVVSYGSVSGEYYWYQHDNIWEKERLLQFTPRAVVDSRSRHRTMIPEEEYENGHILVSRQAKKLQDAGVLVNMGAHGQLQGLGAHWEIWMMAQGGMRPMDALRTATINPARALGFDESIGSLEAGKLADLIVLDGNPLEDIRQTEQVRYTMVNGRLFEAATMTEIGTTSQARSKFYWERVRNAGAFEWPMGVCTEGEARGCGCQ